MASVMRILGWEAEGLRCPDHEVSCCTEDLEPYAVTLVQMPNGTGKTTTLELLRAALSGSADNNKVVSDQVREFRKRDSGRNDGFFEVRLLFNEHLVTIRMVFDFENGRITYKTTRGEGQQDGFQPPRGFGRFLNENFVKFFVFDGELAERLLDRSEVDAKSVVENLFHLNLFESIKHKVENYWENETKDVVAKGETGLTRRRNRVNKLHSRLKELKSERSKLLQDRRELVEDLDNKKAKYHAAIMAEKDRAEKLQKAEAEAERLREIKREDALDTLDLMRDPHAITTSFADSMLALKTSLDKVKLPESAAREFFEELANEPECVCGRPINVEIRNVIRMRADSYLGSDDVAFLNSLKGSIHDAVGITKSESVEILTKKIQELKLVAKQEQLALNDVDSLRIEADKSDPELEKAHKEIDRMEEVLVEIDRKLEMFDSKDDSNNIDQTFGIDVIERLLKDAEQDLAEITQTIELKEKRDLLCRILDSAHKSAHDDIMKEICLEANERIRELIPYNDITIERIDRSLVLSGQEGGSVGETLSVAWGFLATLFYRSDYELPFIVDSPAGPIDLAVRPKIGALIPNLTGQFIAFTISSEREHFITPLKEASNDKVQFITVFRKGPNLLESKARSTGKYKETIDGMKVMGESFFNSFQLDDEDVP